MIYLNKACVEKRFMTRKVTAYCFRKRLLLLPYIYKLCLTQIAHINTTIHHYVDKTDTYHNRKQRKTVHYSHANGTSVLYRTMCPLSQDASCRTAPKTGQTNDVACSACLCLFEVPLYLTFAVSICCADSGE